MKSKEILLKKALSLFVLLGPFVDMLTSVAVQFGISSLTVGIAVRFCFVAAISLYVLFMYRGPQRNLFRLAILITSVYGVVFLVSTVYINGFGVLVENVKMFFKTYFFIYVLLGILALYKEYKILISDKILTIVFCMYTASILLAVVTGTSFYTYYWQQIGYCGWFYAGNEIGAIIAILSGVAMLYGFAHNKYLWIGILGLLAFSCTHIGTKVPFLGIIAIAVILTVFWFIKAVASRSKRAVNMVLKCLALIVCIVLLYHMNSPVKQLNAQANDRYEGIVDAIDTQVSVATVGSNETLVDMTEAPEATEQTEVSEAIEETEVSEATEQIGAPDWTEETPQQETPITNQDDAISSDKEIKSDKIYAIINWLLSNRLSNIERVIEKYADSSLSEKLLGIGYIFKVDENWVSDTVEMDFVAIFIKQGIIGFGIYLMPIVIFAVICIVELLKKLKSFANLDVVIVYAYGVLIGLACAFVAGHVLVAPAVSIYIAVFIVKLYAYLKEH